MKLKKFSIVLIAIIASYTASAQTETTLPFMRSLYQSNIINPGFIPEYSVQMGLPLVNNLGFNFNLNNIDLKMLIDNTDSDGALDLNGLSNSITGKTFGMNFNYNTDLFYLSFPVAGFYVGVGLATKLSISADLSKDLLTGNLFLKGKEVDFSGTNFQFLSYSESSISIAKEIRRFTFGARYKYLIGHAFLGMENLSLSTQTSDQVPYPIRMRAGGTFNTAGLPQVIDPATGNTDMDFSGYSAGDIFGGNKGWAFDIGGTYQATSKWDMFLSLTDIGRINWNNMVYNYNLNSIERTYSGLDYVLLNDKQAQNAYIDSMTNILGSANVTTNSFSRELPMRVFFGTNYNLTKRDKVGFLFQGQNFPTTFYTAYTFNYSHMFGRWWQVTGNYTLFDANNSGVGVGTTFRLGPLQLYYVQDNIMTFISPATARSIYFRFGFNLVFGDTKKVKKIRTDNRVSPDND